MTAQSNSTLASAPYRNMVINSLNFEIFDDEATQYANQLFDATAGMTREQFDHIVDTIIKPLVQRGNDLYRLAEDETLDRDDWDDDEDDDF